VQSDKSTACACGWPTVSECYLFPRRPLQPRGSTSLDVAPDDLPFRAHASRLATCSGLQATPDAYGAPAPPGRLSPLQVARASVPDRSGSIVACGQAAISETCASSFAVELSTLRFRKLLRTTDDLLVCRSRHVVWRPAVVCRLPLALSVNQNPLRERIDAGAPSAVVSGLLRTYSVLRPGDGFRGFRLFPRRRALNLTVPQTRTWRVTTRPLGLTPVVWRLAQVCKLPLTLSVSQNPLDGLLRVQACRTDPRSRIAPGRSWLAVWRRFCRAFARFLRRRALDLTVPQARWATDDFACLSLSPSRLAAC